MENRQKGFISPLLMIVFVLVLIGGSFYLYSNHKKTNITNNKAEPEELVQAKVAVKQETEKLEYLTSRYDAELSIITQVQDNYNMVKESILAKTDSLFSESKTGELSIKVKLSKKIETEINTRREEISNILNDWDNTISNINSVSSTGSVPSLVQLVETAKSDLNTVSNYVKELETVVENLTPSNSGLTQQEINTYTQNIVEVKQEIAQASETINSVIAQVNNTTSLNSNSNSNSNTNTNSGNNTETTNSPSTPVVTVADIKAQEQAVALAQSVQSQIEQSLAITTDTQTSTVPDIDYSIPSPFDDPGETFVGTDKTNWPDLKPDDNSSKPSLLQGTN